jgi:hypothetical protein
MFTKKEDARTWLNTNYYGGNGNRPVRYYMVTINSTTYYVVAIKAHAPHGDGSSARKHFLGVQTLQLVDNSGNPIPPDATFNNPAGAEVHGKALFFNYGDSSDPNDHQVLRRVSVWLM